VVVHDLNVRSPGGGPPETEAELIVHSDTVLPLSVSFQGFQAISRRHSQIIQPLGNLQLPKLTQRDALDGNETSDAPAARQRFRVLAFERTDH
jgi:hypothetical protein|tara:strand:- start:10238 stop:10516 length:279 start_codon:yes stop_codon:yes gene_type:complete